MKTHSHKIIIRDLGTQEYEPTWKKMQTFSTERDENSADELWCLQHPPVFTMGLNGKDKQDRKSVV